MWWTGIQSGRAGEAGPLISAIADRYYADSACTQQHVWSHDEGGGCVCRESETGMCRSCSSDDWQCRGGQEKCIHPENVPWIIEEGGTPVPDVCAWDIRNGCQCISGVTRRHNVCMNGEAVGARDLTHPPHSGAHASTLASPLCLTGEPLVLR